ncbi:MAG TPA: iron-containing redox enzyme family protein [Steroidobacteraceae bacterium]
MSDEKKGLELLRRMRLAVAESGVNDNAFFRNFKTGQVPLATVKTVCQQFFHYNRTFTQTMAGLCFRTESETIRLRLAQTVVSELGAGHGDPHFTLFEKALAGIGITLDDYRGVPRTAETEQFVAGLNELFVEMPPYHAVGAHFVLEETGGPMIAALYEGFRKYPGWKHEDFGYFYIHMIVEKDHVDWIEKAVIDAAEDAVAAAQIEAGARRVLDLLGVFWSGLNRLTQQYAHAA